MDVGPREQFSSTFQLFPSEGGQIQMNISFIENPSSVDITYDKSLEIITPKGFAGKLLRKLVEKQRDYIEKLMDLQMIPLIRNVIQESVRLIEGDKNLKETTADAPQDPLKILKIHFAKGEITEEEYLRKKEILEE